MNDQERKKLEKLLSTTPARIGVGRTGTRPLTKTMMTFRSDHAAAVDAVYGEVSQQLLDEFQWFAVDTCYESKEEYLKRPDKGRKISEMGIKKLEELGTFQPQVQIVVSDGLSAASIKENIRDVYPALIDSLKVNDLTYGTTFFVRGGRVGCMNHIGDLLKPEALVLLIGERPGLVSADSMSAYMCYQPRTGKTDSDRMVISNIHRGGTPPVEAGAHIGTIIKKMLDQRVSGVNFVS